MKLETSERKVRLEPFRGAWRGAGSADFFDYLIRQTN